MADRMEEQVERFAPGFRSRIQRRRILAPPTLQALDANLHGGAINGGTAAMHQQLMFRPLPGTGRPPPAPTPAEVSTGRPARTPHARHCAGCLPVRSSRWLNAQ